VSSVWCAREKEGTLVGKRKSLVVKKKVGEEVIKGEL